MSNIKDEIQQSGLMQVTVGSLILTPCSTTDEVYSKIEKWLSNKSDNCVTRFEYIDENGRQIVERGKFSFQLQDEGRTLKVFKENDK